jgi:hypothetical protein
MRASWLDRLIRQYDQPHPGYFGLKDVVHKATVARLEA